MSKKKPLVNVLQNLALVVLAASAIYLLTQTPLFSGRWSDPLQALLTPRSPAAGQSQSADLSPIIPSFHVMITGDKAYGRFGRLHMAHDDPDFQDVPPLLRDALGSAVMVGRTAELTMWDALDTPSIYLDLTTELPLAVIAAWLETETAIDQSARYIALTTEDESAVMLYLVDGEGSIFRYATALPVSNVQALAEKILPNGSVFAYESNYASLSPYAILASSASTPPELTAALPAGYSTDALLTALDFNAYTKSRYYESSGTEVVVESPRTLHVSPSGTVVYSGEEEAVPSLYTVSCAGDAPTAVEALRCASSLAAALTEGAGASPLYLRSLQVTEAGYQITFGYQPEGYALFFTGSHQSLEDGDALSVTITGRTITAFAYRCRLYTATEQDSLLEPPTQAVAIASIYSGSGLSIGYVDNGSGTLSACWLAG